jgi:hypothetical protein
VAWDIPSALGAGEKFSIKIGVKCSGDCGLATKKFTIYDHNGAHVATGTLTDARWPDSAGLYVAEVELEAPPSEGLYTWSVKCPSPDNVAAHAEGAVSFGVRVVGSPEYLVKVEAFDRSNRSPLAGALVTMHPYRTVTDHRGIAGIRVARGGYKLFVSQVGYRTFGLPLEVTADTTTTAELDLELPRERN